MGTPLHCACYIGSVAVAAVLLQRGANCGSTSVIHLLCLKHGRSITAADFDSQLLDISPRRRYCMECEPFYMAALMGHQAVLVYLLEASECVNCLNREWYTDNTLENKFEDVPEADRVARVTALMAVMSRGDADLVKLVISYGANVRLTDSRGRSALHYAARMQRLDCVRVLVEANADMNGRDVSLATPLFAATESNSVEIVRYLLQ